MKKITQIFMGQKKLGFFLTLILMVLLTPFSVYAQTNIGGVINSYEPVLSITVPGCDVCDTSPACLSEITVANASEFSVGDKVLVIQLKGATIDVTNTATAGQITNIGNSGNYEFFDVGQIAGNTIRTKFPLIRTYDNSGLIQLVRVPVFPGDVNITSPITPIPWDPVTSEGGVVALFVNGTLTFNSDINAQGTGYLGVEMTVNGTPDNCSIDPNQQYTLPNTDNSSWLKGGGVVVDNPSFNRGRGPLGNGGGAGVSGDSGGGGGANFGAGGIGGSRWCNTIDSGGTIAGGLGGYPLGAQYLDNRVYFGGAGGPGYVTTNNPSAASNGGGIVVIRATTIIGNGQTINASGDNAVTVNPIGGPPDGGGGGGAGGSVAFDVINYTGNINIDVSGGNGQSINTNTIHGPGGGGGGGVFLHNLQTLPASVVVDNLGGQNGVHVSTGANNGNPNGAQPGQDGGIIPYYNFVETPNRDGETSSDFCDIDDDNDGILDALEDGGTGFDPTEDADGDGIPNYRDNIDSTVGFPAFVDTNGDGINDTYDFDLDGIPDAYDLDSDNDGIPDNTEAQGTDDFTPFLGIDSDGNGLDDAYETTPGSGEGLTPENTDGDALPDFLDLDSDNDTLSDTQESGLLVSGNPGYNGRDANQEIEDFYIDSDGIVGRANTLPDTDGDEPNTGGDVDFRDTDSDNDGVNDGIDIDPLDPDVCADADGDGCDDCSQGTDDFGPLADNTPANDGTDTDGDGICDVSDNDSDNDGVPDASDICNGYNDAADSDNDGVPDGCDLDDDNDGILDTDEYDCSPVSIPLNRLISPYSIGTDFNTSNTASGTITDLGEYTNASTSNSVNFSFGYEVTGNARWAGGVELQNYAGVNPDGVVVQVQADNTDFNIGSTEVITLTFTEPVYNLSFKWGGMDNQDATKFEAFLGNAYVPLDADNISNGTIPVANYTLTGNTVVSTAPTGNAPDNAAVVFISGAVDKIILTAGKNNSNTGNVTLQLFEVSYCLPFNSGGNSSPNHLDTDSDGDSCADAIEGAGNFTPANLDGDDSLGDTVDGNGVPTISGSPQSTTTAVTDSSDDSACNTSDLSITKVASTMAPIIGFAMDFTIEVSNNGPDDATGVNVLDQLPSGYQFVSVLPSQGTYDSSTGIWDVGTIINTNTATLVISAAPLVSGNYQNTAEITSSNEYDPDSIPGSGSTNGITADDGLDGDPNPIDDDEATVTPIPFRGTGGTPPDLSCADVSDILDWDTITWTNSATTQTINSTNGTSLTFSFSGDIASMESFGHALNNGFTGGLTPAQLSLRYFANFLNTSQTFTNTIDIGTSGVGVTDLSFRVFDVDTRSGLGHSDKITVIGYLSGTPVQPVLVAEGNAVSVNGNTAVGILGNGSSSAGGNLLVTFDGPIDQIEIINGSGDITARDNPQSSGYSIHDISFCTVQEIVSVSDATEIEGTNLIHTVTFNGPSASSETYAFSITDVSTSSGSDYDTPPTFSNGVTLNGTGDGLIIPAGVTSFTITNGGEEDTIDEADETYTISVGGTTGTGTIEDNDGAPTIASVTNATETEGTDLVHTVTLSNGSASVTNFPFSITDVSASSGLDYDTPPTFSNGVTINGTGDGLIIPAGVTSFTITNGGEEDTIDEADETYTISVGGTTGTGTIEDNDGAPTIASITNASETEGTDLVHTVTLSNSSASVTNFPFSITDVSASSGLDYDTPPTFSNGVTLNGTGDGLIIPAGVTSFTITNGGEEDTIDEADETYTISVGGTTGTGTIEDNDSTPTIASVTNATETEGTDLVHTVTLSNGSASVTNFPFSITDVTTTSGSDYDTPPTFSNGVTLNGTGDGLIIPAGVTSFTITNGGEEDTIDEGDETYTISVGGTTGTGTIEDNDTAPTIASVTNATETEGTDLVHTVTLSNGSASVTNFPFSITDVSTSSGSDYDTPPTFSNGVTLNGTGDGLIIPAGVTSFTITNGGEEDTIDEGDETYTISVGGTTGTGTIEDNDTAPTIASVTNASETEGTDLVHTVTLSNSSASVTNFPFSITDVSTSSGSDYDTPPTFSNGVTINGTGDGLIIPAGVTSFTITNGGEEDTIDEADETYTISVGGTTGTGTIEDNDGIPTIASVTNASETEGTDLVHTVTLSNGSASVTNFAFSITDVTTTSGSDYDTPPTFSNGVTLNGTGDGLIIPAGVTSFTITNGGEEDTIDEADETYTISVGGTTGTGTIEDNDTAPTIASVTNASESEGTDLVHTVTLSNGSASVTNFAFSITDVTTTSGSDYDTPPTFSNGVTLNGTGDGLIIPAGVTSFTITNGGEEDTIDEGDETYTISVGGTTGTGTIEDNDFPSNPELTFVKTAVIDGFDVGDVIVYTFRVTNTGDTVISNILIDDALTESVNLPLEPSTLAPNETGIATANYTITAADINLGEVMNSAIVIGQDTVGNDVIDISDSGDETIDEDGDSDPTNDPTITVIEQLPNLELTKTGIYVDTNGNGIPNVGDEIRYVFTIENTGNVDITNIVLSDPLPGIVIEGNPIDLVVGGIDDTSFTATYILTEEDILAGNVINQAFATGQDPNGNDVVDISDDPLNDTNIDLDNDGDFEDETVTVIVPEDDIIIYTAISPNGDNVNDEFRIIGLSNFPKNTLQIFNRWGVKVFEEDGYEQPGARFFEGISEGRVTINEKKELPVGTYYYTLRYENMSGILVSKAGYLYINK